MDKKLHILPGHLRGKRGRHSVEQNPLKLFLHPTTLIKRDCILGESEKVKVKNNDKASGFESFAPPTLMRTLLYRSKAW